MQINVSQQLKSPIGTTRNYRLNEAVVITDGDSVTVKGEVTLLRTNHGLLAKGRLHTEIEAACSRCLNPFTYPLTLNVEEEYYPTVDIISGAPLPIPEEPGALTIDQQHVLDLTEAIRQCALITIPMKPLCHEDCAGLCPRCGHNLNLGPCRCTPQEIDPRWSELTNFLPNSPLQSSHAEQLLD